MSEFNPDDFEWGVFERGAHVIVNWYWVGRVIDVGKTTHGIVYKIKLDADGLEFEVHGDQVYKYDETRDYGELYNGQLSEDGIVQMIRNAPTRNHIPSVTKEEVARALYGDEWGPRWNPLFDNMLDQMIRIRKERDPKWNTDEEVR